MPNTSSIKTVRVDTYLSAGQKLMINVRTQGTGNYVPYITYIQNAHAETRNSVRVAWRNTSMADLDHGTEEDYTFTGTWEVMTVPAGNIPLTTEIVSSGVPATNGGWVNPPTSANRPAESSTLREPSVNGNGIQRSILVGYMTDKWYEGAILKYNIRTGN